MRSIVFAAIVGCSPAAMNTGVDHPASPQAPTGRLAGPPPALAPGVADISIPEPAKKPDHANHAGHAHEPEPASPEVKPETKQPAPRKQAKPPASKQAPAKQDKPKQPPAHTGHEGHH